MTPTSGEATAAAAPPGTHESTTQDRAKPHLAVALDADSQRLEGPRTIQDAQIDLARSQSWPSSVSSRCASSGPRAPPKHRTQSQDARPISTSVDNAGWFRGVTVAGLAVGPLRGVRGWGGSLVASPGDAGGEPVRSWRLPRPVCGSWVGVLKVCDASGARTDRCRERLRRC